MEVSAESRDTNEEGKAAWRGREWRWVGPVSEIGLGLGTKTASSVGTRHRYLVVEEGRSEWREERSCERGVVLEWGESGGEGGSDERLGRGERRSPSTNFDKRRCEG